MKLSLFARYLKPYVRQLTLGPLFKLAEAVLELYLPLLMARVIDRGAAQGGAGYVRRMGLVMLGIVTVGLASALVCQYMASVASQGFGTELRRAVFGRIGGMSHAQMERFGAASLVNRVTNDIQQLQVAVAMLIRLVIRAPFLCIGGTVMALLIDARLSLILLAAMPLFVLVIAVVMRSTVAMHRLVQKRLDTLTRVLRENLSGVRVIRAFARTGLEQRRFREAAAGHADAAIRVGRFSAFLNPVTQLIMNMAILAIVWFGGVRVEVGGMTTGEVIAFINYMNLILQALIVVANLVIMYTRAYACAGRVQEVLLTDPAITDAADAAASDDLTAPAVEFRRVSFRYEAEKYENRAGGTADAEENASDDLAEITFAVPRGATVGVIGGTGSGKSTVMQLILRFYDVSQGEVLVNGRDVRQWPLRDLREAVGFVPQKTELFSGTIAENIRWGGENATDEQVRRAARDAQALDFIERKPKGFDAPVERGGVNFSGGQRQRLTIARALVRNPSILILDDSSSALDYATDAALRKAVRAESRDRTVFVVSQRVTTVRQSDLILVMDDGRLAGAGTHEELMNSCAVYREIVESQNTGGGDAA